VDSKVTSVDHPVRSSGAPSRLKHSGEATNSQEAGSAKPPRKLAIATSASSTLRVALSLPLR
jgi:hypothetical protein